MEGTESGDGNAIAVDISGNVYTTGSYTGMVDFDPGAGTYSEISVGGEDIFISKLDASGKFIWAKSLGGTGSDIGRSLTVDSFGNVYVSGYFRGTVDFDPGTGIYNLTSVGQQDIFISKLDTNGNFVWAKNIGGTSYVDANSIALDQSGNVYTTGWFNSTADFDPGKGTHYMTSAGSYDIFISKLDAAGNFMWAKSIGGTGYNVGTCLTIDQFNNIYTTGNFSGTVDFDPGTGIYNLTSVGQQDIFISKLDTNGNFVWAKNIGGTSYVDANSIALDQSGNVYTTGWFKSTADFDPDTGTYYMTSVGYEDIFISKLDLSGNFVWAKRIGGNGTQGDRGKSIALDKEGNIYVTGFFQGTLDFDQDTTTFNLISIPNVPDIFVLKLNDSGNFVWAKRMGGTTYEYSYSIVVDEADNVFITGTFSGTVDFDPDCGVNSLTAKVRSREIFIVKLGSDTNDLLPDFIEGPSYICEGITTDYSINFMKDSTNFNWTVPTGSKINYGQNTTSINVTFGTKPGNVKVIAYNSCGSDSSSKDVFVIKEFQTNFQVKDICESDSANFMHMGIEAVNYYWKFGDGETSDVESPKHYYKINGNSKTYNVTLVAKVEDNCSDSITKVVTVKANPISDFSYNKTGNKFDFKASQKDNTLYQWNFGNNDSASSLSTDYSYTYSQSNTYSVCLKVTSADNCFSETCKNISTIGISKTSKQSGINIYPNPNSGRFEVHIEKPENESVISVYNAIGQLVAAFPVQEGQTTYPMNLEFSNGICLVRIETGGMTFCERVVVAERFVR